MVGDPGPGEAGLLGPGSGSVDVLLDFTLGVLCPGRG